MFLVVASTEPRRLRACGKLLPACGNLPGVVIKTPDGEARSVTTTAPVPIRASLPTCTPRGAGPRRAR